MAEGPIALCEVQGYAYEAAIGRGGPAGRVRPARRRTSCAAWAAALRDGSGRRSGAARASERYPALALDGDKRRVDSLTSNIGHLLGTGLLDPDEERLVARQVAGPDLDSGLGLRTMAATRRRLRPAQLPLRLGLAARHRDRRSTACSGPGSASAASGLVEGLLRAAVAFDRRLPELWSGEGRPGALRRGLPTAGLVGRGRRRGGLPARCAGALTGSAHPQDLADPDLVGVRHGGGVQRPQALPAARDLLAPGDPGQGLAGLDRHGPAQGRPDG